MTQPALKTTLLRTLTGSGLCEDVPAHQGPDGFQGYMVKRGAIAKNWKRRYFVLQADGYMLYYASSQRKETKGSLKIQGATILRPDVAEYGRAHSIGIRAASGSAVFLCCATSEADYHLWLEHLSEIAGAVSLPTVEEGFLCKMGHAAKGWKKRYFLLNAQSLQYFKNKGDKHCAGEIFLRTGTAITPEPVDSYSKDHCFSVTPFQEGRDPKSLRVYVLHADDAADMERWIKAMQTICTHQAASHMTNASMEFTDGVSPMNLARDSLSAATLYTYTHTRTHAGHLKKEGGRSVFKKWQLRYFVLSGATLSYFKEEADASPQGFLQGIRPLGDVFIPGAEIIDVSTEEMPFAICVTPSNETRKRTLVATTAQEVRDWIAALTAASQAPKHSLIPVGLGLSDCEEEGEEHGDECELLASPRPLSKQGRQHRLLSEVSVTSYVFEGSTKEGFLVKGGKGNSKHIKWRTRYCIMKDDAFVYYGDTRPTPDEKPKGCISLNGADVRLTPDDRFDKECVFSVTPLVKHRIYVFQARNEKSRDRWIQAIRKQMVEFQARIANARNMKEGYLLRLEDGKWKRRYFVLADRTELCMYKSHQTMVKVVEALSLVSQEIKVQLHATDLYDRPSVFTVGDEPSQLWTLAAESQQDANQWVDQLLSDG